MALLRKLAASIDQIIPDEIADLDITGIALDSRNVEPGNLFAALTGLTQDGHQYIPQAIKNGTAAVVGTRNIENLPVPYFRVPDDRAALAKISAAFYDHPSKQLTMIGVTGTDGKTTTSNLIFSILKTAGFNAGMISTVNAVIGDQELDTGFHVTTPESPDTHKYLRMMVDAGLTHVVLEATSHGLEQKRVAECNFDIGVLTNIRHEHLDYHGTYEAYRAAKGILFKSLEQTEENVSGNIRAAVINRDDISYEFIRSITGEIVTTVSYGLHQEANIRAENINHLPGGIAFDAVGESFRQPVRMNLLGEYNVSNALAAFSTTVTGLGMSPEVAAEGIFNLEGIPGRMESIDMGQDFMAIVDFAHTPNALRQALTSAQKMTNKRIIAVFGAAGLRDREKRRMMAEISGKLADFSIFTAEDPRTEALDDILGEMAAGAVSVGGIEGETFIRIPDRGEAIYQGLIQANPGDIVLSLGKGHEQSMCFGETEYPWDDRIAMRSALAKLLDIQGPEMLYLPTQKPG